MSFVERAVTDELIYSSLGAYGSRRGGELPGAWFVAAFATIGRTDASVRQALFRMSRNRELASRRVGRDNLYRLTPLAEAAMNAGTEKIFGEPPGDWDGRWSLCRYRFSDADRVLRDRMRTLLETEGFASLGPGLYIHPRDRVATVSAAVSASGAEADHEVQLFRADLIFGDTTESLVSRLWDLDRLDRRYRELLALLRPLAARDPAGWSPAEAFGTRFGLVMAYLEIAWDDPDLPTNLLPRDWAGHTARRETADIYRALLPGTLEHGDGCWPGGRARWKERIDGAD